MKDVKQKEQFPINLLNYRTPSHRILQKNESSPIQKSVVDMSKQSTARMQIKKYKSKSIDQEPQILPSQKLEQQKQIQKPRNTELSNLKLQKWIQKELEQLKETKKLQQTTYKGFMVNEKQKSDNFQKLFELTSLKLKNSYVKYFF